MKKGSFDSMAYFRALDLVRESHDFKWKQVGEASSVSASTLTRMAQGKRPDADSLAKLSAWSGLNPAEFVSNIKTTTNVESLNQALALFRADPHLTDKGKMTMEAMITAAYNQLKKNGDDEV